MKKILFLIVGIFLGILQSYSQHVNVVDCKELPQKTSPTMAINDFAGIMDAGTKDSLEQQSRRYFDSTTISVAVITVPDMKGYEQFDYSMSLFNCWGIGTKNNRGVLLMVALKEKKISVRTGDGIEFALTDLHSNAIIQKMKPFFKEGKYNDGIQAGVASIFETLGTMSWEDRMQGLKEKEATEKALADKKAAEVVNILLAIGAFILFILLFVFLRKFISERKKMNELKKIYGSLSKAITTAEEKIEAVAKTYSTEPLWAQKEAGQHLATSMESIQAAFKDLEDMRFIAKTDPYRAEALIESIHDRITRAFSNFKKADQSLRNKIKQFRTEAPDRLLVAMEEVDANIETLEGLRRKGYKLDDEITEQKDFKAILEKLGDPNDRENHRNIWMEAPIIKDSSSRKATLVTMVIDNAIKALSELPLLRQKAIALWAALPTISKELEEKLKKAYPPSVWDELEKNLDSLSTALEPDRLTKTVTTIEKLLGLDVQKLYEGLEKFEKLSNTVSNVSAEHLHTQIKNTVVYQEESKQSFGTVYGETKEALDNLMQKVKNPDVSKTTTDAAKKAAQRLKDIKIYSLSSKVDWVILVSTLHSLQSEARGRAYEADKEITTAETKRVTQKTAREDKPSYKSSYSSRKDDDFQSPFTGYSIGGGSFGSDSGGGGFGGFDGGSSGGGGADGGW